MYLDKQYYPTYWSGCNPIHAVMDWSKVRRLVRDALKGNDIPPILIDGDRRNGSLLTGTHRAAANDILMMIGKEDYLIPYVTLDDIDVSDDLRDAIDASDFEAIDYILDRK